MLLHDIKVWIRCSINVTRINGPTSFSWHNEFTNRYCTNPENVSDQAGENCFFHQDGATTYTAALCNIYGDHTIRHPLRPAHLPNLTRCGLFSMENHKNKCTQEQSNHTGEKLRNYKEQSISDCKIRYITTSKCFKLFVHQVTSKSVSWTK